MNIKNHVKAQFEQSLMDQEEYEKEYLLYLQHVRSEENFYDPFPMTTINEESTDTRKAEKAMLSFQCFVQQNLNNLVDQYVVAPFIQKNATKYQKEEKAPTHTMAWFEEEQLRLEQSAQKPSKTVTDSELDVFFQHEYDADSTKNVYMQLNTFMSSLKTVSSYKEMINHFK